MKKLIIITVMACSSPAWARTFLGEGAFQKSAGKESTRWTLADWITQKKSFKAMDQWLALNRSLDLFEVTFAGGRQSYDLTVGTNVREREIEHYGVALFWSIFGIEYQFENSNEDFKRESAQFNLRLLGTSSQTTNLTAFYGLRKWTYENPENEIENQYAGGRLNLYVTNFFGLEGEYRKHMRAKDDTSTEIEGDRVEYGAFIDVFFVRIFARAFKEKTENTASGATTTTDEREGTEAGVKFYM